MKRRLVMNIPPDDILLFIFSNSFLNTVQICAKLEQQRRDLPASIKNSKPNIMRGSSHFVERSTNTEEYSAEEL